MTPSSLIVVLFFCSVVTGNSVGPSVDETQVVVQAATGYGAGYNNDSLITTVGTCKTPKDCSYNGYCTDEGLCHCDRGWVTHDPSNPCGYEQKKQLIAFLLNFFLGKVCGAGYFYTGQMALGAGQVVLFWSPLFLTAVIGGCLLGGSESVSGAMSCLLYPIYLGAFGWWVAVTVRFGLNYIPDENGVSLMGW